MGKECEGQNKFCVNTDGSFKCMDCDKVIHQYNSQLDTTLSILKISLIIVICYVLSCRLATAANQTDQTTVLNALRASRRGRTTYVWQTRMPVGFSP